MMRFEEIGPYDLNRGDLIMASLVISFILGERPTRIFTLGVLAILILVVVVSFVLGDTYVTLWSLFMLAIILFVPGLKSLKNSRRIYLSYDPEGLSIETANVRTVYKWAALGKVQKVGTRLYIMISSNIALVVGERLTSRENMDALIATVAEKQKG